MIIHITMLVKAATRRRAVLLCSGYPTARSVGAASSASTKPNLPFVQQAEPSHGQARHTDGRRQHQTRDDQRRERPEALDRRR